MKKKLWVAIQAGLFGGIVTAVLAAAPPTALDLRNTVTGEPLNLDDALPDGRDTDGVKKFLQTGRDPYLEDPSCLRNGQSLFLTACSGCHGHLAEGKIGPGLNDDYWTYPKNQTDQGIFETVFGGARSQMGPHYLDLTLDEMLQVIAWVRHLYKDDVKDATWFTAEQKKSFKPFKEGDEEKIPNTPGQCKALPN
ncbi:cytochrome c(L), periplasmic [Methyloferula stellata]|uniref:cytochrome c(L), periplasmic n=1 Tax=Methyloferula stellata TaxID=876270 RepID=UPI00037AF04A